MSQSNATEFIKQLELFGVAGGMPRSTARVLGYLIICEPSRQSSTDIQKAVALSSGSVSSALAMLRVTGLIERYRAKDQRSYYYELDSEGWRRSTIQKLQSLGQWVDLAEQGLRASPRNPRLVMMRDIFKQFDQEFADIARRLGA